MRDLTAKESARLHGALTDDERESAVTDARSLLVEMERQACLGYDSIARFERDIVRAKALIEQRDAADALAHELAGLQGETMGLSVTAGFFQRRCEVMEKLFADGPLTEAEQDVLKGCCPVCGPPGVVCRGCGLTREDYEAEADRVRP